MRAFDSAENFVGIDIVGSMFKAWLRELPTEILLKVVQDKIATECHGEREVPQLLRDELSSLPPWNYYLLFATTCHLSLITACAKKKKMTYHKLCVCFQPALRIEVVQDKIATECRGLVSRVTHRDPSQSCPRQDCNLIPTFEQEYRRQQVPPSSDQEPARRKPSSPQA